MRDGRALFSGGLRNLFALADLKMDRLLDTFDEWARTARTTPTSALPERFEPTRAPAAPRLSLDLAQRRDPFDRLGHRISSRLSLARRAGAWTRKGHLRHDGGVVDAPGLYAIGLPVLRRRKSTFIHGAEDDARDVVAHLARSL